MRGVHGRGAQGGARPGRRRTVPLLALAGLMLIGAGAVVAWRGLAGVDDVGGEAVERLSRPPAETAPAGTGAGDQIPVTDGRRLPESTTIPPTELSLPAIDLTVRVDPVGIEPATGDFAVPPSVDRVGWYAFGPGIAAERGSIVIAGHVDDATQGEGAFYRLAELVPGDRIEARDETGKVYAFEVVGREVYDKDEIPLERYFARGGEPRLTLITCGGEFDPDAGRYRDNVVVTAIPIDPTT